MKNHFADYHPSTIFAYSVGTIILLILYTHPILIMSALLCGVLTTVILNGGKNTIKRILAIMPVMILTAIITPLVNNRGITPIIYINDKAVTLEGIFNGIFTGVTIATLTLWIFIIQDTLGNEKFLYLFGRKFPKTALIITMIFRFIPDFKLKLKEITDVQKQFGIDTAHGNIRKKLRDGSDVFSTLISLTVENSVETADSMTARGFELPNKTSAIIHKYFLKDIIMLAITFFLLAFSVYGYFNHAYTFYYYPRMPKTIVTSQNIALLIVYIFYMLMPIIIILAEELRWLSLKSKI